MREIELLRDRIFLGYLGFLIFSGLALATLMAISAYAQASPVFLFSLMILCIGAMNMLVSITADHIWKDEERWIDLMVGYWIVAITVGSVLGAIAATFQAPAILEALPIGISASIALLLIGLITPAIVRGTTALIPTLLSLASAFALSQAWHKSGDVWPWLGGLALAEWTAYVIGKEMKRRPESVPLFAEQAVKGAGRLYLI